MTMFITMAIPLSVLATIIAHYFMGWSLNVITLNFNFNREHGSPYEKGGIYGRRGK
ncbi:MAG: hypothetical protein V2A61_00560 [Calditrichota bacterium]